MKELVEVLAKFLVDKPDEVKVREFQDEKGVVVELRVAPEDMGRVIGRQGKVARAIRALAKAKAAKIGTKVLVEINS